MNSYKKIILYTFLTYIVCWCGILLLSPALTEILLLSLIPLVLILLIVLALTFIITKADKSVSIYKAFTLSNFSFSWVSAIISCYFIVTDDSEFFPGLIPTLYIICILIPIVSIFLTANFIIWLNKKIKQKRKC